MGGTAFAAKELFYNLSLELRSEISLVCHSKVFSPVDYTLTLPNLPSLKCPTSGIHSTFKRSGVE